MSLIGPFMLLGGACNLVLFSSAEQLSVARVVGCSLLVSGVLGLIGVAVDWLGQRGRFALGYGMALGVGASLTLVMLAVQDLMLKHCQLWVLVFAMGLAVLVGQASRHARLPAHSLAAWSVHQGCWLDSAVAPVLVALVYRSRPAALALVLGTCVVAALVVGTALLVRHRRLSRLVARAVPVSIVPGQQALRVVELGVGSTWHCLQAPASYRKPPSQLWLHGEPGYMSSLITRRARLAGVWLLLSLSVGAVHWLAPGWGVSLVQSPPLPSLAAGPPFSDWSGFTPVEAAPLPPCTGSERCCRWEPPAAALPAAPEGVLGASGEP